MLSIAGGVALFLVTVDNIKDPNIADLMNNISASLLSIPIVFLLYDYSNYKISKKLNQTLATSMSSRLSATMLGLTILLRQMTGMRGNLTLGELNKMRDISPRMLAQKFKTKPDHLRQLGAYHTELDDMIYKYGKNNILDVASLQNLGELALDLLHLINELEFHKDKKAAAKYTIDIFGRIADWLDSDAGAAMNFQKMLQQALDTKIPQTN